MVVVMEPTVTALGRLRPFVSGSYWPISAGPHQLLRTGLCRSGITAGDHPHHKGKRGTNLSYPRQGLEQLAKIFLPLALGARGQVLQLAPDTRQLRRMGQANQSEVGRLRFD